MIAAIEGGGTKFRVAVGVRAGAWEKAIRIPTRSPEETLRDVSEFLKPFPLRAVGVAMFGPLDVERGAIFPTPKVGWSGFEIVRALRSLFGVPIVIDSDVNAAAFGEFHHSSAAKVRSLVYWTVGTGIGAGAVIDGAPVHGRMHPELGHIRVRREPRDVRKGQCEFHGDCVEGLASGRSITSDVDCGEERGAVLQRAARHIGRAVCASVLAYAPGRIVVGGGVLEDNPSLLDTIRESCVEELGPYLPWFDASSVLPPQWGSDSALVGAFLSAERTV